MKKTKSLISPIAGPEELQRAKNEILLYSGIYSYTIESLVREINTFADDDTITIRMHTPGGGTMGGSALLSRLTDRAGGTKIHVDGFAYSMGAFMCCYVKKENVVASEDAKFMFHKAAYPSYYEPDEAEQRELKDTNAKYKKKMKERLNDSIQAKELINKVFESDVRNDVYLTAKEAKAVGLIGEVKPINPDIKAFIIEQAEIFADYKNNTEIASSRKEVLKENINSNSETMTKAELKVKHPELYASIFADGEADGLKKGIKIEADRVGSFLPYYDAAPEAVLKAIKGIDSITETQRTEFSIALHKKAIIEAEKEGGEGGELITNSPEGKEAEAEKKQKELEASIGNVGLTIKK